MIHHLSVLVRSFFTLAAIKGDHPYLPSGIHLYTRTVQNPAVRAMLMKIGVFPWTLLPQNSCWLR